MPFSFLMMPAVLAAAIAGLLAVIPLIVHLLNRQKVTPVQWGAMMFLLETPLKMRRKRRIDNWVLMLLRMALLALLVFLLARPTMTLKSDDMVASLPTDVAVVIDHSMTMGMKVGGGGAGAADSRFEQGIDVTERLSRMLPSSGTMSVVLAESAPRIMTPAPIKMGLSTRNGDGSPAGEWASTLQTMRALKPGLVKGEIPSAVQAARELLSHGYNTRKIIFVVSDDQRSNWDPNDDKVWKNALGNVDPSSNRAAIPVYCLSTLDPGVSEISNVSVKRVDVTPTFLGIHRPATIMADVSNTGTKDLTNVPLVLEVDGKQVAKQTVSLPVSARGITANFDYYFPDPGSHYVRVRADVVDALDADNAATAAVNVKAKLPVLIIDGQLTPPTGTGLSAFPQAACLLVAMQPVDPTIEPSTLIEPKIISAADLATGEGPHLEDYPIVIINDVPRLTRQYIDRLAAHAQSGNGVWIILGPRTEAGFINDVLAHSTLMPVTTTGIAKAPSQNAADPAPNWVTIDIKEPKNPALAVITSNGQSEHSVVTGVTLRQWWTVAPAEGASVRTVLATTTGDPLMVETQVGKAGGKAVLWTTSAGTAVWSNLPLEAHFFLPLVNETLFSLAGGQEQGQPRQLTPGTPITWTGGGTGAGGGGAAIDSVQVIAPDGNKHTLHPEMRGDHYFVQDTDTLQPGLYEMRFIAASRAGAAPLPPAYYSVSVDPQELDPAVLTAEDFAWFKNHQFLSGVIPLSEPATVQTELGKAMQAARGGRELWKWFALLVLIVLVVEVAATYGLVRRQAGKRLEEEGLDRVIPKGVVERGNA